MANVPNGVETLPKISKVPVPRGLLTHGSFGPPESSSQRHLDQFSCFCTANGRVSLYFIMGRYFFPKSLFPWGSAPPSNTWFLGPIKVSDPNGIRQKWLTDKVLYFSVPNRCRFDALVQERVHRTNHLQYCIRLTSTYTRNQKKPTLTTVPKIHAAGNVFCDSLPWPLTFDSKINGFPGLFGEHFDVKFDDQEYLEYQFFPVEVSALICLQCFNTVGWTTGWALVCIQAVPVIPSDSLSVQTGEETQWSYG